MSGKIIDKGAESVFSMWDPGQRTIDLLAAAKEESVHKHIACVKADFLHGKNLSA